MSNNLKLHSIVAELLAQLNIDEDPSQFIEVLSAKSKFETKIASFPLAERISKRAADLSNTSPENFMAIYSKLKDLQARELNPLLLILDKFQKDSLVANAVDAKFAKKDSADDSMDNSESKTKRDRVLSKSRSLASLSSTMVDNR
jgi:hypothetical protein